MQVLYLYIIMMQFMNLEKSKKFIKNKKKVNFLKFIMKRILIKFFKEMDETINETEFLNKLKELADIQLEETLNNLEPVNRVNFFEVGINTTGYNNYY
jgi:uncharacterized protein (UPF0305 family)